MLNKDEIEVFGISLLQNRLLNIGIVNVKIVIKRDEKKYLV